jgi:hypothetical protein
MRPNLHPCALALALCCLGSSALAAKAPPKKPTAPATAPAAAPAPVPAAPPLPELDLDLTPAPAPATLPAAPAGKPSPAKPSEDVLELPIDEPAKPAAKVPAPAAPAATEPDATKPMGLTVGAATSFGWAFEDALGTAAPQFRAGLSATYAFKAPMSLALALSTRSYRRGYMTRTADVSGAGLARPVVDEAEHGVDLVFGYDVGGLILKDGRLELAPLAGPSVRVFANAALPSTSVAVALGARASWRASELFDVRGTALWGYNLAGAPEGYGSALGGPLAVSVLNASFGLKVAPQLRLGLGYEGEIVTLGASTRGVHGLSVSLDVLL